MLARSWPQRAANFPGSRSTNATSSLGQTAKSVSRRFSSTALSWPSTTYKDESELSSTEIGAAGGKLVEFDRGENHGVSVFCKNADGEIFHTYSAYNRGIEALNGALGYFDLLPKGRA